MKRIVLGIALVAACCLAFCQSNGYFPFAGAPSAHSDPIANSFSEHRSGVQVTGEGVVSTILPDDIVGRRHQRFTLSLRSGHTLLVAHNIELAPRIELLKSGDLVEFNGVYEWNAQGGVIHWTHRDPRGQHAAGWLKHGGQTYQ